MGIGEIFIILIVIWTPCILCDRWDDQETRRFVEEYIPKLQQNLRRADDDSDENYITSKTILKNNRRYDVHLIRLRDVNGVKRHNLIVKEKSDDNPLIYVINPVETKIPHPYVSQAEFKDILNDRVKKQRNEVYKKIDPLFLPINFTYWTKVTWSKPTHRSTYFSYNNFFKRRQHNTSPYVSKTTHKIPPIPYKHYLRNGKSKAKTKVLRSNKTSKAKTYKTQHLRSNRTGKIKNVKAQYLRSNRTSKIKTVKAQYLRSNRTSKALSNNATTTLKKNETIKAEIIYLRSNRSIITKGNKGILQNLSTKPMIQSVSNLFERDQNISITDIISKVKIIGKPINKTIERQTTEEITMEKSTTVNEIPPTKIEVTDTTEVLTTTEQSTEEVTSEEPTTLDIPTEKLNAEKETNIESSKTVTEIIGDSKNEEETTKIPTYSEITIEKITTEEKTTDEPTTTETVNTEHCKEEEESMATENTAETTATEDTTIYNDDITGKTDNNTESLHTEVQEVDLATDETKVEETTQRKALPFRTKGVKRTTTKPPIKTKRPRLSRPLVFMGDQGNGNSWK